MPSDSSPDSPTSGSPETPSPASPWPSPGTAPAGAGPSPAPLDTARHDAAGTPAPLDRVPPAADQSSALPGDAPPPNAPAIDFLVDDSPAAWRTGAALVVVAALALLGNCLLTSPGRFSEKHQQDTTLLKPVVSLLGLGGAFPTTRGVEIRNLVFYIGAAILALIAAIRLASSEFSPRLSGDDLLDFRGRASSPYFWWLLLLVASILSSTFSHAPDLCRGQTIIRFLHLAWWWPLAALLTPRHVRGLAAALLGVLGLMIAVGLWYYSQRNLPGARLQYPIGNELWLAACLLPAPFIAIGLLVGRLGRGDTDPKTTRRWLHLAAVFVVFGLSLVALFLTQSRSAGIGFAAGAFAVICFVSTRTVRRVALLAALVLAIAGARYTQKVGASGVMGERAHSVRIRLNYEWPYALTLAIQKPMLGWGDGAYSMLAGQFARDDQLDDPATISFNEWSWPGRADSEPLQLLAELGLVGLVSFLAAIALTIYRAVQFCDRTRGDPDAWASRWLTISLAAALIAVLVEECSSPAFREPGLPPVLLTVWAALWALARPRQPAMPRTTPDRPLSNAVLRLAGVGAGVAAVILGYFGVQDWRGARAQYEANTGLTSGQYQDAFQAADFGSQHILDPFQNLGARMFGVGGRWLEFERLLRATQQPSTDRDLALAQDALVRLTQLDAAAPRFIRSAHLRADLNRSLAWAYNRRGESGPEQEHRRAFVLAWEQHRADEPFLIEVVEELWKIKPDATSFDRLVWLRCLLRNGEVSHRFRALFEELLARNDIVPTLTDLFQVATQDLQRSPSQWLDRLSPETFRVAALAKTWSGEPTDGVKLAHSATVLYEKAGPRLFAAHAAAIHEEVRYQFRTDPTIDTDQRLQRLAEAYTIRARPTDASTPLPDALGYTRLCILLAAGRQNAVAAQLQVLKLSDTASTVEQLATVYVDLAGQFGRDSAQIDNALRWAQRASELAPNLPDVYVQLAAIHLHKGDDAQALDAAERFLSLATEHEQAAETLQMLERLYPGRSIWQELRRRHPDFPPPPLPETQPATDAATTRPVSAAPPTTSTTMPGPAPQTRPNR